MIAEHRFRLVARCPVDGAHDVCDVTIRTSGMVPVEAIVGEAKEIASVPRYQEDITRMLAERFSVEVETSGTHMRGEVSTICRAGTA